MKKYELLLILPGTLDDTEVEARSQEIVSLVKDHAENVECHSMGKNRLAYPVKQIRYGYYYTITCTAESAQVKTLEEKLRLMRDLLRAMISHFNVDLSAQQKLAFSTPSPLAVEKVTMTEAKIQAEVANLLQGKESSEAVPESKVARSVEKLDMDQINKKLDDLMSGDVIPGV